MADKLTDKKNIQKLQKVIDRLFNIEYVVAYYTFKQGIISVYSNEHKLITRMPEEYLHDVH